MALLAGGDYDKGVVGCGATTARGLAKSGFGDSLLSAFQARSSTQDFATFLSQWRHNLCQELITNAHGFLDCRHAELASNIPKAFPNTRALENYANPLTSWSQSDSIPVHLSAAQWQPREPVIHHIASFCIDRLGWDTIPELLKILRSNLWNGIFCRMLCDVCNTTYIISLFTTSPYSLQGFMTLRKGPLLLRGRRRHF